MAKNEIERSQQQEQGITIGTQGNNDAIIPGPATHGGQDKQHVHRDRQIPNQEHSSAGNERKTEQERNSD